MKNEKGNEDKNNLNENNEKGQDNSQTKILNETENDKNIDEDYTTPKKKATNDNINSSSDLDLSKAKSEILISKNNINDFNKEKIGLHYINPSSYSKKDEIENESKPDLLLLEHLKLDNFDEKKFMFQRKYNTETRKYGRKFYIYRYLKENKIENNKEDLRNKKYFLLITIEKAIFFFNHKKYKESIELLINEKVIKNNLEFGEFLFVIDGFDKNIMNDFLLNDELKKEINMEELLTNFINCINMDINHAPFFDTLKFFLSCINYPKKQILDIFSSNYFMINKDNESFIKSYKTSDNFITYVNSLMAINNGFIGKEKNNIIKIGHFVEMNKDLDKKLCQNIYKEFQLHPIFPSDNYVQKYYKKISPFVKENDENEKLDKKSDIDYYYENILNDNPKRDYNNHNIWFSYRKNISIFDKNDEEILLNPITFTKYVTNSTSSHPRVFVLRDNFTYLIWAKSIENDKIKGNLHTLKIDDIVDIYIGVDNCEIIKKYLKSNNKEIDDEYNYITVKTKTDVFVIRCDDIDVCFKWFKALKSLLFKYQMAKNKDKERINENKKTKIEKGILKIWNACIFNKWTEYGRYLLYKKQNKIVYKKVIGPNNKKEKIIKSDLIDDRFNFNSTKIILFMNEVKNKIIGEGREFMDYNEFLFLYKIGIPQPVRNILWDSLIDNVCGITKDIYDYYYEDIKDINFEEKKKKINEYNEDNIYINEDEELNNKIINDIVKLEDLFINELYILEKSTSDILSKAFKFMHIFLLMRKDIPYNKNIINYAIIFNLVFNDPYICFKNLFNFICSSYIIKYLIKDESYIKQNCEIFGGLLKKLNPKIYNHFCNLDINVDLFFVFWAENLFTQTLNYKIILRIIDLFLIYGEELIFQIGLTIIKIQEEDLLNYPINEIFKVLKRLPNKYDEELFFENLDLINIHEIYNNRIVRLNLSNQLDFICSN